MLSIVTIQCTKDKPATQSADNFTTYLESLDQIDIPFEFNTRDGLKGQSENYDTALFSKYKHAWSVAPYGRIAQSDDLVKTIEVVIGDMVVPVLMIYDKTGVKLDSLNPLDKAGGDIGYQSDEYVAFYADQVIVIDSTRTAELNAEKDGIIEGTWKLTVDTAVYQIDKSGKIKKVQ
jgi:hypothetical protein